MSSIFAPTQRTDKYHHWNNGSHYYAVEDLWFLPDFLDEQAIFFDGTALFRDEEEAIWARHIFNIMINHQPYGWWTDDDQAGNLIHLMVGKAFEDSDCHYVIRVYEFEWHTGDDKLLGYALRCEHQPALAHLIEK